MTFGLWDVLYVVVVGSVVGFMLADRAPGSVSASLLLVGCLAWSVAHRLFALHAALFVAVLSALHLTAVWLDHTASFALFAWGSMVFATLPLRPALLVVAVLDLVPVPLALLRDGTLTKVHGLIPLTVLGLAFAIVAGTYIARLTDQNEERAAMIAELSASRAEVARLSHEAGVLTERARLAAEIHDTLAQGFTSIITLAQAATDPAQTARRLEQVVGTARDNLAEARALVAALSPADLHTAGLVAAVRRQLSRLAAETGIRTACHLPSPSWALIDLPTAQQVVLLRSLQEALTNVRKHAGATTVDVWLTTTGTSVALTVTDDGAGFTVPSSGPAVASSVPGSPAAGYGLAGMRARVEDAGGICTIESRPGAGTTITVELS
ncbi:sensor histidine kinase [Dactylosporangium sp. NPDC050588]|uniref:sensor histidine kinase n=1 Tax=Dactylosporangium sp. NPDC050588 TaxID=3157211 RepID=UPI003404714E